MKIGTKIRVGWKMKKYNNQFKTRQGIIDEASRFFEDRFGNPCLTFLTEDGYRTAVNYVVKPLKGGSNGRSN